jgi:exonuclease III
MIVLWILILFNSCAKDIGINKNTQLTACDYIVNHYDDKLGDSIQFGTDSTLDILTWNLENFPKRNSFTIDSLIFLINNIDADIIAFQEIGNESYFNQLLNHLHNWDGERTKGTYGLAYLFKSSIGVNSITEISELNELTRTPFLLEVEWYGNIVYIINNHYKCCGDGKITDDQNDQEFRRLTAVKKTKEYLETYLQNQKVVLLGDLNDNLSDNKSDNIFWDMISDDSNFRFTDLSIACNSSEYWSYPSWPSHLDHIMITNELFNNSIHTQTVFAEKIFSNNWIGYDYYISDHRPVGIRLFFSAN